MNISKKLIDYRDNHNLDSLGELKGIDPRSINVIVTELLSWLKLERKRELWIEQGKRICLKDMELNMNYPWCKDLSYMLQTATPLSEVFCIEDGYLRFKSDVSDTYKHEARAIAYEQYDPQMVIG